MNETYVCFVYCRAIADEVTDETCPAFLRHKRHLVSPKWLESKDIRYFTVSAFGRIFGSFLMYMFLNEFEWIAFRGCVAGIHGGVF